MSQRCRRSEGEGHPNPSGRVMPWRAMASVAFLASFILAQVAAGLGDGTLADEALSFLGAGLAILTIPKNGKELNGTQGSK